MSLVSELKTIADYNPTAYVNNSEPDLDAEHLNKTEQALKRVTDAANDAINALKELEEQKLSLNAIVQTESTATDKVPSSAYLKQALGTINSNFSAEIYDGNIDTLHKNCVVQIISGRTTGTFPNVNYTGSFLSVVNNGPNFTSQRIDIITNKNTASYKRSWYYGNDTDYPGWSDWRKVITNSDLPILTVRTGTRYWTQYTEVSGQKRIYFYNADFPSGDNLLGYIALTK